LLEAVCQLREGFAVHAVMTAASATWDAGRIPVRPGHGRSPRLRARPGQMALTIYTTESVIGMCVFTGVGLRLDGQLERIQL
jgi:uncharacterized membrane protein YeiB